MAFALRDSIEAAKAAGAVLSSTKICGGGAKVTLWRSYIIANVTGLTVERVESEQGPALGVTMLARWVVRLFRRVDSAAKAVVRVTDKTLPDAEILSQYEKNTINSDSCIPRLKRAVLRIAGLQESCGRFFFGINSDFFKKVGLSEK